MDSKEFKTEFAGKELKIELGKLALQANGSALVTYGQTVVLATCVLSRKQKDCNWLPLTVDYEEKLYAVGKIRKTRFTKREFRGSEQAIKNGRLIDRTIRPRFNQKIRNEIQVIVTVLCFDKENSVDIPSLIAVSTALSISNIPWQGPIAGIRIGRKDDKWTLNPSYELRENSEIEILVAGTKEKIKMLELEGSQTSEDIIEEGIELAYKELKPIIEFQERIAKEAQPQKIVLETAESSPELANKANEFLSDKLEEIIYRENKSKEKEDLEKLKEELTNHLLKADPEQESNPELNNQVESILEEQTDKIIHKNIL